MTTWRMMSLVIVTLALLVGGMFLVWVDDKPANSTALRYTFSVVNV